MNKLTQQEFMFPNYKDAKMKKLSEQKKLVMLLLLKELLINN